MAKHCNIWTVHCITGGFKLEVGVGAKLAPNPHPACGISGKMGHGQMMAQHTRMIWIRMWIFLMKKKLGPIGTEMMAIMMTTMSHGG